jgi:hypothetical protein
MAILPEDKESELFWRSITIGTNSARWKKLAAEHQRQFARGGKDGVKIYWREKDGKYTFLFSPLAAINAKVRLKGFPLAKISTPENPENDGYKLTDRVEKL